MITIKQIKKVREDLGLDQVVLFGISSDRISHVATHGKTEMDGKFAADLGNKLKKKLEWPQEFCESKPLERICYNCSFFNSPGACCYEHTREYRANTDPACHHFEPHADTDWEEMTSAKLKEISLINARNVVEKFNAQYPVGRKVLHRGHRLENFKIRTVAHTAMVDPSGKPVAWFVDVVGYSLIDDDHVQYCGPVLK
jgi:hypothetical protein